MLSGIEEVTVRVETSGGIAGRLVLAAFFVEAILAGGNSVAIRFSNRELAPLWGAGLRFGLGAVLIVAVMAALKLPIPRGKALTGAVLFGLFQFAGAFGLYREHRASLADPVDGRARDGRCRPRPE